MSKRVAVRRTLGVAVVVGGMLGGAGVVRAQPAPCARPPLACPRPTSTQTWVFNSLTADRDGVCRFDEKIISPLMVELGDDVAWDFCNACAVDIEVQIDTPPPGPFKRFDFFLPMPNADNEVRTTIPCHGWGTISGHGAREGDPDSWKYFMRARAASSPGDFPDIIDPDLVIDDSPGLHRHLRDWGVSIGLLLLGLLIGWLLSRRRQ
jgi:hypothetical protein